MELFQSILVKNPLFLRVWAVTTVILLKDYHNKILLSRIIVELMGNFSYFREFPVRFTYKKKKRPQWSHYKIMAINPPEPSLIILSKVSFNLYLAFSGIISSFA